jgi:hypothetical protein
MSEGPVPIATGFLLFVNLDLKINRHDFTHALSFTRNVYLLIRSRSFSSRYSTYNDRSRAITFRSRYRTQEYQYYCTSLLVTQEYQYYCTSLLVTQEYQYYSVPSGVPVLFRTLSSTNTLLDWFNGVPITIVQPCPSTTQTLPMIRSLKQRNSAPCRAFVK